MTKAGFLIAFVLAPSWAAAFQPLITDDTGTQGAGGEQLEASLAHTSERFSLGRNLVRERSATYTQGVAEALDLFFSLPHQHRSPFDQAAQHGWGNPAVGAKWRFYDENKLSFALRPELRLPASATRETQGLGSARTSWRLDLLMTRETGFGALHANLAATRVNYADESLNSATRRSQLRISASPVWDLGEAWKLAIDAGIMTNPERSQRGRMGYAELGGVYSPSKAFDLALGLIRYNHDGAVRARQWTAGATWRF